MTTMPIYASDESLLFLSFERAIPDFDFERAVRDLDYATTVDRELLQEVLGALDALAAGWLEPLAVSLQVVYRDLDNYFEESGKPPRPHYFLRESDIPSDVWVSPQFIESQIETVSRVTGAATKATLLQALAQEAPARRIVSLEELWWTATRALSPDSEPAKLNVWGSRLSTPEYQRRDEQLWYLGPSGIAGPPVRVRVSSDYSIITIDVSVYWDLWIGNAAGRALLDAGCDRIIRRGWKRSS